MRRMGRIARQPGHTRHAVVLGEIRFKRPVVDRPVVGYPVQRPHPEVGRIQPRVMGREEDRAATGAVAVSLTCCAAPIAR
jgi:hypothetical protein